MRARFIIAPALLLLGGCGGLIPTLPLGPLKPYQMDVQQGNYVTQDMIAKVQPGMSRNQVRFALGTPLVTDMFHQDRWDYVYQFQRAGVVTEHRRIVVVFKDDRLVRVEGDVVPGASPAKGAKQEKPSPAAPQPAQKPAPDAPAAQ